MPSPVGLFDRNLTPAGWFDKGLSKEGWFDETLIQTSVAGTVHDVSCGDTLSAADDTAQSLATSASTSQSASGKHTSGAASLTTALSQEVGVGADTHSSTSTQFADNVGVASTSEVVDYSWVGGATSASDTASGAATNTQLGSATIPASEVESSTPDAAQSVATSTNSAGAAEATNGVASTAVSAMPVLGAASATSQDDSTLTPAWFAQILQASVASELAASTAQLYSTEAEGITATELSEWSLYATIATSITQPTTSADAQAVWIEAYLTHIETVSATHSNPSAVLATPQMLESIAAQGVPSTSYVAQSLLTEAATALDSSLAGFTLLATLSGVGVALADQSGENVGALLSVTEVITATSTQAGQWVFAGTAGEAVFAADLGEVSALFVVSEDEAGAAGELNEGSAMQFADVSEVLSALEQLVVDVFGPSTLTPELSRVLIEVAKSYMLRDFARVEVLIDAIDSKAEIQTLGSRVLIDKSFVKVFV